jgi:regulatory protein
MTAPNRRSASGPPPTAEDLHAAALAHLARYATTKAGLRRVLLRRIERWARAAGAGEMEPETVSSAAAAARQAVPIVVARLAADGAVDDASFAASRAQKLIRGGRSRHAVAAHLAARGIDAATARAALPEDTDTELAAALALARRRHLGPFRTAVADAATVRRELGVLARAGFPHRVAACALGMDAATAEAIVLRLRRS